MSFTVISVPVNRLSATRTATGGRTTTPTAVTGSPFQCRLYRAKQNVVRIEGQAGVTTLDNRRVLSFLDIAAPVQVGDIATLPGGEQAKITRRRVYDNSLQCDIETGAS